jgi:FlaG/FlaF family flagellin (archaellin)
VSENRGGDRRGTAPVVGNVLLVGLAVVMGAMLTVLSATFLGGLGPVAPGVAVDTAVTDGEIRFEHRAGDSLAVSELELVVETADSRERVPFTQGTLGGDSSTFAAGDLWRYCQVTTPGEAVEMRLVHTPSNAVLATVERSARETRKTGVEYRCGSAARQVGRGGGWATFNLTNYADEPVEVVGAEVTSDTRATRLEGLNESGDDHVDLYIDADSEDLFSYRPEDGYAYSRPSADAFDIGDSPERIDMTRPSYAFDTAVLQPGESAFVSLYQFQDAGGEYVDVRGAELTVTLYFADRPSQTYSVVLPRERAG